MIKGILSSILALFLVGCGGGSTTTTTETNEYKTTEEKGNIEQNDKEFKTDSKGKIKTIKLSGSSESVAVNKDALFVAKGKDGVDIVKIGYNDTITSEFVTSIDGINAKSLSLSKDGKKLYVVNDEGYVNIINIDNISNPKKERITTQQEIQKETITKDGKYKFVPMQKKGFDIFSISSKGEKFESSFNKANAYDILLIDKDTKALIASGTTGIYLLHVTTPTKPSIYARFIVDGGTKGISLNEDQGLLFVANGDNGVLVYHLNTMLDKLSKEK